MKFNLLLLINLATVVSIGSSSINIPPHLHEPRYKNCSSFIKETVGNLDCKVSEEKRTIEFTAEALPYVCLLYLDVGREFCKVPTRLKKLDQMIRTKYVCPIEYSLKSSNLEVNLSVGIQYLSDENNCNTVCKYSRNISQACQFITFANKIIKEDSDGESSLPVKDGKQSQDLLTKDKTVNLAVPVKISQEAITAPQTKPNSLQDATVGNSVQIVADDKFEVNNNNNNKKPVVKTSVDVINKNSSNKNFDLKSNVEGNKTNSLNYGDSETVKKPVFKSNESNSKKQSEINKLQVLQNDENTDILETESPSVVNTFPNSKTNPINNNNNNNNPINNSNNNNNSPINNNDNNNNNNPINNNNNNNNNKNINNIDNIDNIDNNDNDYGDDSVPKTSRDEEEDDGDNNNDDLEKADLKDALTHREPEFAKSLNPKEIYSSDNFFQAEDSHFSVYFLTTVSIIIIGYVIYHNKKKIVAYALEGRRNRNGRRRPTSASYRKLDCNLEEAIASNPSNTSVTNVVY